MPTIKIGGMTFTVGRSISINGKQIFSDGDIVGGAVVEEGVKIELHGDIESLRCDSALVVVGNIKGNVEARGPVTCDSVGGNVTTNGPVTCDDIGGDVKASIVTCDDIAGNVTASMVTR